MKKEHPSTRIVDERNQGRRLLGGGDADVVPVVKKNNQKNPPPFGEIKPRGDADNSVIIASPPKPKEKRGK